MVFALKGPILSENGVEMVRNVLLIFIHDKLSINKVTVKVTQTTVHIGWSFTTQYLLFIATTSFTHTRLRQEVISFSLPLTFSSFGVFIKNPASIYNYTAYLETLTYWSWLGILIFLMAISISLYAIMRLAEGSLRISFGQNFEAVFRALLLLDSQFALSKTSTRLIFTVYVFSLNL